MRPGRVTAGVHHSNVVGADEEQHVATVVQVLELGEHARRYERADAPRLLVVARGRSISEQLVALVEDDDDAPQ
jgi:hypothetical protein